MAPRLNLCTKEDLSLPQASLSTHTESTPFDSRVKSATFNLVQRLAQNSCTSGPSSFMSICIYDTAWASTILKTHDDKAHWLFPESFQYVLANQGDDGSWSKPADSQLDGVLNTMAALLACAIHRDSALHDRETMETIDACMSSAKHWLQSTLSEWDVTSCDQVGFEMLLPSLYRLLRTAGIELSFPALDQLLEVRNAKLSKLDPSFLYKGVQATVVHCLEALVGVVDFDRLTPLLRNGSMMNSPAATAAYLRYSTSWNDEAECYLKSVFASGAGNGSGAFPSACPAEVFETSWVMSTLLEAGLTKDVLGSDSMDALERLLSTSLQQSGGTVGFSAHMLPDADDTSKSLQTLYMLGNHDHGLDSLIRDFNGATCFRTYQAERNASFTANCNVIKATLYSSEPFLHHKHLARALDFVCDKWNQDQTQDKWNTSVEYSYMLLGQALSKFLQTYQSAQYHDDHLDNLVRKASTIISQIVGRTLMSQGEDGTWGGKSHEITSYAVLTLAGLANIPQIAYLSNEIMSAIHQARDYLTSDYGKWQPSQVWVEKVTYSSPALTDSYCLAALFASDHSRFICNPSLKADKKSKHLQMFFGQLPLFKNLSNVDLVMKTAFLEAQSYCSMLEQIRYDVFPSITTPQESTYLQYIPVTWIACNNSSGLPLAPSILWEMMQISMLNFQADHYIETVLKSKQAQVLRHVRRLIDQLCDTKTMVKSGKMSRTNQEGAPGFGQSGRDERNGHSAASDSSLADIEKTLTTYVNRVLYHPYVRNCSQELQALLRSELSEYLQAQIDSITDNETLLHVQSPTQGSVPKTPRPSIFHWVRTTGADHTSCPYSYVYFLCLISGSETQRSGNHCFETPTHRYIHQALYRHLATMCRIHNDYGSFTRDQDEGNFNCFECAEFESATASVGPDGGSKINDATKIRKAKDQLLKLAEFERACLNVSIASLEAEGVSKTFMDKIKLFVNVTDLYGQIYVARDIGMKSQ